MPEGDGLAALEAARSPLRIVSDGDSLYAKGDPSDRSYTLLTGWIAIYEEGEDGRRQIVHFAMPGDVLVAERQEGGMWSTTAVAVGDVIACSISRARNDRLRRENPDYADRHLAQLQRLVQFAYEHIANLALGNAKQRLAHLLLGLASRNLGRRPVGRADAIPMPLSQIDIALATGLTPVHVSRTLRLLREDGVLELHNHTLRILDLHKVDVLAGAASGATALWTAPVPRLDPPVPSRCFETRSLGRAATGFPTAGIPA